MPLLDQGEGTRQQQPNEINPGYPKLGNWPSDAVSIDTDQNPNVDGHRDPHRQIDDGFLRPAQTVLNSTTPNQVLEPG